MKRILTFVLAVVLLVGCFPVSTHAAQTVEVANVGGSGYRYMTSSQKLIDMIKVQEGFYATAYWDYSQWTIGYGSFAGSYNYNNKPSMRVTPAQAEVMLKEQLAANYEPYVNNLMKKIGKQPTQNQFDALVSLTYNVGPKWTNGSALVDWLKNPTTEMDFVNAFGQWGARAGGTILYALVCRRVREAIVFTKGVYSIPYAATSDHNMKTNLPVIDNGSLPYYGAVVYQYDYTTSKVSKGNGHAVAYFPISGTYVGLQTPSRPGYTFAGWKITRKDNKSVTGGAMVTAKTRVTDNLELTAQWTKGSGGLVPDYSGSDAIGSTAAVSGLPFVDIRPSDWFVEDVRYVYNNDYMIGTSNTRFSPDEAMTRGMLVTILYRMAGEPSVYSARGSAFTDVGNGYYTSAVAWAKAHGIVYGVSETKFAPDEPVTRQQAVTIVYRFCCGYMGASTGNTNNLGSFVDSDTVDDYAVTPMKWAVGNSVLSGDLMSDRLYLDPFGYLSRSQAAAILKRCDTKILN